MRLWGKVVFGKARKERRDGELEGRKKIVYSLALGLFFFKGSRI